MNKRNLIVEAHWTKNYKRLVKVITRRVPNQSPYIAEEVVQEAYTLAMKYYRTFDPKKSEFNTWFEKILRNAVNKCKTDETGGGSDYEIDDQEPAISISKNERELLQLLLQNINSTTGYERDVLVMFYYNGFKSIEIAEFMNKKHSAIRQVIFRWRTKVGLEKLV